MVFEPGPLRSSAAHVFVAELAEPVLSDADHRHLARSLRLRPGEMITVSDGQGGWRTCAWVGGTRAGRGAGPGALEPTGEVVRLDAPRPAVTVGFALTKGQDAAWMVQKLTEAGVDRMAPMTAARSVVRWDEPTAAGHVERWRRLTREAAMQARRVWLPVVEDVAPFEQAVSALAGGGALAEPGGEPPSLSRSAVLVGPEGGWEAAELQCGLPTVALGASILRAGTAALAAGVVLCALRERLVAELAI